MRLQKASVWLACALFAVALAAPAVSQPQLDADDAEDLVRQTWYEGLPEERAAHIGPAGVARLANLLEDASEREHHANILMALGHSSRPGAYEAIAAFAARPPSGEVDRATFRAWQVLPHALGALANGNRHALQLLASQLDAEPSGWHFGPHDAHRIAGLTRRAAATSLGHSLAPEAVGLLRRAAARHQHDEPFRAHLEEMLRNRREQGRGAQR